SRYIFGMEGSVMSASRIPPRKPFAAIRLAREAVTKDFPTPPLPLTTPTTCFTSDIAFTATRRSWGLFRCEQPSQLVLSQVVLLHSFAILLLLLILIYFINLSIAFYSSLIVSRSPFSTSFQIQFSMCSCVIILLVLLIADFTAESWIRTSEQSLPSSTIRLMDSRWPMARERRFSTAFVCAWL